MVVDESLIEEIVRRVVDTSAPDRIILFGSAASGQMKRDSDIDLLVIKTTPGDHVRESVRLRQALRGLGYPFDVIVISREWFEETKGLVGGIAYPAHKYGKVIYAVS